MPRFFAAEKPLTQSPHFKMSMVDVKITSTGNPQNALSGAELQSDERTFLFFSKQIICKSLRTIIETERTDIKGFFPGHPFVLPHYGPVGADLSEHIPLSHLLTHFHNRSLFGFHLAFDHDIARFECGSGPWFNHHVETDGEGCCALTGAVGAAVESHVVDRRVDA